MHAVTDGDRLLQGETRRRWVYIMAPPNRQRSHPPPPPNSPGPFWSVTTHRRHSADGELEHLPAVHEDVGIAAHLAGHLALPQRLHTVPRDALAGTAELFHSLSSVRVLYWSLSRGQVSFLLS